MSDPTNERKLRHLQALDADPATDRRKRHFDEIRLKHRALPELNLAEVDPSIVFMGKRLAFPLLISSMTGGNHEVTRRINRNLAQAAEQARVAMGVGSQRVMFSDPASAGSFDLRPLAPTTLLFSNLGAVQLNRRFGAGQCREAIRVVGADALCFHLNPLQEAMQPDGDTDFSGLAAKLAALSREIEQPIVLKEVGSGISEEDVRLVLDSRIRYIDVAGTGGTSWSRIEHHGAVAEDPDHPGLLFEDWGLPTPVALRMLDPYRDRLTLIASGGVRSGLDMVKAMVLGASLCGMAAPFIEPAQESAEAVLRVIALIKREFVTAMFLLGLRDTPALIGNRALICP